MPSEFWGERKRGAEPQNLTTPSLAFTCPSHMCHGVHRSQGLGLRCSLLVLVHTSAPRMPLPLDDHQGNSKLISSDPNGIMSIEPLVCLGA